MQEPDVPVQEPGLKFTAVLGAEQMGLQGEHGRGAGKGAAGLPAATLREQHMSTATALSVGLVAQTPFYDLQREMGPSRHGWDEPCLAKPFFPCRV